MKATIEYEFKNCEECPFLTQGVDSRNHYVYICRKKAFGKFGGGFKGADAGEYIIPKIVPFKCPYNK